MIQTLIEYSIRKNKNITVDNADMLLPLYTKAGFRVNCEKDRLMGEKDHVLVNMLQDFEKQYDIPQKQLKAVLKKRSRNGVSGFGESETYLNFCELLYQKK